jgi:hypothetical protein
MRQAGFKRIRRLLALSLLLAKTRFALLGKPPPLILEPPNCLFLDSLALFLRLDQPPSFRLYPLSLENSLSGFLLVNDPPLLRDQSLMLYLELEALITDALSLDGPFPLCLVTLDVFDQQPERQHQQQRSSDRQYSGQGPRCARHGACGQTISLPDYSAGDHGSCLSRPLAVFRRPAPDRKGGTAQLA